MTISHTSRAPTSPTRATMLPLLLAATLAGCVGTSAPAPTSTTLSPQEAFFEALASHCGKAYAGALVSDQAADADMRGRPMVMHVRECRDTRIAVPFHVGNADGSWDRSRTWLVTRTETGLRLKHDHRHEDGTADAVTFYGGDTAAQGTAQAQEFPVDAESIAMFRASDLTASITNVWRVEVDPAGTADGQFAYQLQRPGRLFRVEFDLTRPVTLPPAPWGHE